MRNLKKVLSLSLALVMLLGMMVVGAGAVDTGFADDAAIKDEYKTAAAINKALGLMTGDGTSLNAAANITRAEAFILSLRVDGSNANEIASKWPVSEKPFNDVSAGKWYAPYLAYGKEMGLISGNGGNYNPDGNITVVEYSILMLGKLGFDPARYTGAGWNTNAASDALAAGLYDGLGNVNYYTHQLTRQEACQMVFKTILYTDKAQETGEYKINVTTDSKPASNLDGMVCSSRSEAAMMVTLYNMSLSEGDEKVVATYEAVKDNSGSLANDVFGLTWDSTETDEYGNPCTMWSVGSKEILSVPNSATKSYEGALKAGKIYSDLGLTKATAAKCTVTVTEDGEPAAAVTLSAGSSDTVAGAGAVTNVYKSGNNVKIVVVNTYIGSVAKVTDAKGEDPRYVTLTKAGTRADTFVTEDFAKGDVVLYTKGKDGEIISMELAEEVTGKLEKITNGEKWTVDGNNYVKSEKSDTTGLGVGEVGKTVTFYVDAQGNIMKVKDAAAAETRFIYVLASSEPKANSDYVVSGKKTAEVYAVLANGTVDRFTVTKMDGEELDTEAVESALYTYDTDSNGYLELTKVENAASSGNIGVNDTATEVGGEKLALNSSTVFVFIEVTDETTKNMTVKNITVKTGIANIGDEIANDDAAVGGDKGAAKVVFVMRGFNSVTDTNAVVYVTNVTTVNLPGSKTEFSVDVLTAEGEKETYTATEEPKVGHIYTVTAEGALGKDESIEAAQITKKIGNRVTLGLEDTPVEKFVTDETSIVDTTDDGVIELAVGQTVKIVLAGNGSKVNNIAVAFVERVAEPDDEQKVEVNAKPEKDKVTIGSQEFTVTAEVTVEPGPFELPKEAVKEGQATIIGDNPIKDWGPTETVKGFAFAIGEKDKDGTFTFTLTGEGLEGAYTEKAKCTGKFATGVFYINTAGDAGVKQPDLTEKGGTYFWTITFESEDGKSERLVDEGYFTVEQAATTAD